MARINGTQLTGPEAIGGCVAIVGLLIALFFVASFITMVLWNVIVPNIFGGGDISYPEALALTAGLMWVSVFFRGNISRE